MNDIIFSQLQSPNLSTKISSAALVVDNLHLNFTENQLASCWYLISPLSSTSSTARSLVSSFMTSALEFHYSKMGPILRMEFFSHLNDPSLWDNNLLSRIQILSVLTKNGRDVKGFETEICPCIHSWLSTSSLDSEPSLKLLSLLTNLFKFSFLHLDDSQVADLLLLLCSLLETSNPELQDPCTSAFDSVIRYGNVPVSCLLPMLQILTKIFKPNLTPSIDSILLHLFSSHLAASGISILLSFITHSKDIILVSGSLRLVSFLHWSDKKINTLETSNYFIVNNICSASTLGHSQVDNEITLALSSRFSYSDSHVSLLEWEKIVTLVYEISPHFMQGNIFDWNPQSIETPDLAFQHLCTSIKDNYQNLLPESQDVFIKMLYQIQNRIGFIGKSFLIENNKNTLSKLIRIISESGDINLAFKLADKITLIHDHTKDIPDILPFLETIQNELLFNRWISICQKFVRKSIVYNTEYISAFIDQLETTLYRPNSDIVLASVEALFDIWESLNLYIESRMAQLKIRIFNIYTSCLRPEMFENVKLYIIRFLCRLKKTGGQVSYFCTKSQSLKSCPNYFTDIETQNVHFNSYLSKISELVSSETSWTVYSTLMSEFSQQLKNVSFFTSSCNNALLHIGTLLIDSILSEKVGEKIVYFPEGTKRSDSYMHVLKLLNSLVQNQKKLFSKRLLDDLVLCLLSGLSRPSIARYCIHSLIIGLYEYPQSMIKHLHSILTKLSQSTSLTLGIANLEFLSHLGRLTNLHLNLTENDFKRVFGTALQYIRIESTPSPSNTYINYLANHVLCLWFVSLPLNARRVYVSFISKQLLTTGMDENVEIVLDMIALYTFADCKSSANHSNTHGKTWVIGNVLVSIQNDAKVNGWQEIIVRRPSGTVVFSSRLENMVSQNSLNLSAPIAYMEIALQNKKAKVHTRSLSTGSNIILDAEKSSSTRVSAIKSMSSENIKRTRSISLSTNSPPSELHNSNGSLESENSVNSIDPSFLLAQVSGTPNILCENTCALPILLPSDDITHRAISVLDRTPVIDLHKIGVLYVSPGQTTELEILGNSMGSKEYCNFLNDLGTWVRLDKKGSVYSGGLDTSEQYIDGKYSLIFTERLSECVFHIPTIMPASVDDPQCLFRKRHIGNDFINIIWNESGIEYDHSIIQGQFNFMVIIITPLESGYEVSVKVKPEMPSFSLFSQVQIISKETLGSLIRNLAVHLDTFSQIWSSRFQSSSKDRLTQIRRLRSRMNLKHEIDLQRILDFSIYL